MNTRDLPGYGDAVTWGAICSPNDPRYAEDIGAEEAIEAIAEHVFDQRVVSVEWVGDAHSSLSNAEYRAIDEQLTVALSADDDSQIDASLRLAATILAAVRRELRDGAKKEARIRLEKLRREDEAEAAAARMEC